jgi:hypothetical protein
METTPFDVAIDVLSLTALIFVLTGLLVWLTPALQLLRWIDADEARMKVFWSCTLFGFVYGAAFGSLCELTLWLPSGRGALSAVLGGAVDGALLGAFGGGVAGFVGNMIGWRIGWTLAGGFGSAAAAACVWTLICLAVGLEPDPPFVRDRNLTEGAIWCSGIILVGGLLGTALDRALRSGRSFLPGVQRLASVINHGTRQEREP